MIFLPVNGELQLLKGQSERIFLRAKSMGHPLFVQSVSCNLRVVPDDSYCHSVKIFSNFSFENLSYSKSLFTASSFDLFAPN